MASQFFYPLAAMVGLTAIVWGIALAHRIAEVRTRRIPLQSLARARDAANTLQDTQSIDNFNNLLQMPVVFYVFCLAINQSPVADGIVYIAGAWFYVVLRILHSVIQLTHNIVSQRFYVWVLSNVVLFVLWGKFVLSILIN